MRLKRILMYWLLMQCRVIFNIIVQAAVGLLGCHLGFLKKYMINNTIWAILPLKFRNT